MDIRAKIVAGVTELFLDQGIKSVTMDEVAQNLGISKRTIYEHFENKVALIQACTDALYQRNLDFESTIISTSDNIIQELFKLVEIPKFIRSRERRFAMELKKFYPEIFDQQYVTRYKDATKQLSGRLRRGIEQGIILPDTNIDVAVYVIFESVHNLMSNSNRILSTNISVELAFEYIFVCFFRGIATAKGIALIDQMNKK
ncbi:MAG: TetR/AcrR family transcriptional regulator [Mucinivorans sp.]